MGNTASLAFDSTVSGGLRDVQADVKAVGPDVQPTQSVELQRTAQSVPAEATADQDHAPVAWTDHAPMSIGSMLAADHDSDQVSLRSQAQRPQQ